MGNMNKPSFVYAAYKFSSNSNKCGRWCHIFSIFLSAIVGVIGISNQAKSESLLQALSSAYVNNPILSAERARQRATDENMPIARSNFGPTLSLSGDVESTRTKTHNKGDPTVIPPIAPFTTTTSTEPWGYTVSVNQPIFRGFRSLNEIRSAEAQIFAGRELLRTVEQTTLLNAVSAFADVWRDFSIVRLLQGNVRALSRQLKATKDRFNIGEVTSTDVAQAEVRLSGARSNLSLAQSDLKTSRAVFEEVVGEEPRSLKMPSMQFRFVPRSVESTLAIADSENPSIVNAIYLELQARHDIDRIRGELLPTINLEASFSETFDPSDTVKSEEVGTVVGRLTFPFYQGGAVHARIRQAKQIFRQRTEDVRAARLAIRREVLSAWGEFASVRSALSSGRVQVSASEKALEGVKGEERVGQRTVLDILDSEQELVDAQVSVVILERDLVVAAYTLLKAMGRLTAVDLGLAVEFYDAEQYYHEVRRRWFGKGPRIERVEHNRHSHSR